MSDSMRAILVGCGGISRTWLKAIAEIPEVQIVGLVDMFPEAAAARKDEFGLNVPTGSDLGAMLDALQPEAVFNCTVPEAHVEIALQALTHGCHVLGEKPLADSMDNARRMVAAAEQAGRILAVIQNRRYAAPMRRLRHLVASGQLGPLTTVDCDFYIGAHFGGFRDHMPHVLLVDMAIHTFDQARMLSGADPVSVYCHEWNPAGSWYDHDASAVAIFEMTGGIVYTYRGSWCAEGRNTSWESEWRLIGQQGTVYWDGYDRLEAHCVEQSGEFLSKLAPVEVSALQPDAKLGNHAGVIRDFTHCVLHGGTPETVARDNIKSLAMVFGAVESAQTHRQVSIRL